MVLFLGILQSPQKKIPICSVTILGWPDLQGQIDPRGKHASDVFTETEFEKHTGAAARSGHFHCLCDSFTIINTGIPYCVHGRRAVSSVPGSRDNYTDLGTMFSVCALRKHDEEFASRKQRDKEFSVKDLHWVLGWLQGKKEVVVQIL